MSPTHDEPTGRRADAVLRSGLRRDWDGTERSAGFVDMVRGSPGFWDTRAEVRERDGLVFLENDAAMFIHGGDCSCNLEFNAAGTVNERFFVWQDAFGSGTRLDGTLNDDTDRRWPAAITPPWAGMTHLAWASTPHGRHDTHRPELVDPRGVLGRDRGLAGR